MAKKGKLEKAETHKVEERPARLKKYKYLFLIVCEDQKTEPAYFEQFKKQIPEDSIYLETVGTGKDAKGVVEEALKERDKLAAKAKKEVDVVWVVFDKDDADLNKTRIARFEEAFKIGEKEKLKIAYSNEVFELWLLLHLADVDASKALPRAEIYTLLGEYIRQYEGYTLFQYEHGNTSILAPIQKVGDQAAAIKRAEELLKAQSNRPVIEANPSTRVFLLVNELLEWIAYFNYQG